MRAAGRMLYGMLGRAVGRLDVVKKTPRRVVKGLSYALMTGGIVVAAHGMLDSSLSLALVGVSFLAMGIFARTIMEKTRDISERLYEGQERILVAIRGPTKLDENGKPVAEQGNLMAKMDEVNDNLMAKMDELIGAVNRLSDNVYDLARGRQGQEAGVRPPEPSASAEDGQA